MVGTVDKYGIAFFGIHKAATSSVKHALWFLREGVPWQGDPMGVHPYFPNDRVSRKDFEAYRNYWRFTVIRDPIKRFLSAYQNRVIDYEDLLHKPGNRQRTKQEEPSLTVRPDIEAFIANYEAYCRISYSIHIHTCSSRLFIGNDLRYFNAVYTTSQLDHLKFDLSKHVNREIRFDRINESGSTPPKFCDLSCEAQSFLLKHTAKDYELFQDYFTPPVAKQD
ncbi:sulfotransferase family 2 domain-containing protein [Falsirhodobacter halotolerans]|uniref:sulfotransferase family 2 domain-containing protein n=1 Tax=Falsirhodobacter halotolerans TaxID=1146892 RepID=UPI001FD1313A|nr:sulfotransferase family 2 domain-containing protein [Falsirhodobacter halotolerans]MCJ8139553.1 sulfotransferase family protein [Falsirhodobacter halotolerans]